MAEINIPLCAVSYGDTGFGDCVLDPKKIKGAFQVTSSFVITDSDLLDLQQFLKDKVLAPIGQRIFPMHNFISIADNTEDIQIETTDYGTKLPTRDGDYDLTFRYQEGGVMLHQEIQKNRGTGKYFIFYDEDGVLYGYKTAEGMKGIPALFIAQPWRFATGSTAAQYLLRFIFQPQYINYGNLAYIGTSNEGFNLFDIKGLQDVVLKLVNLVGNVATVLAITKISGVNMYDAFSTNLTETTAWKAKNETGGTVAVTGISANPTASGDKGGFDVTFSSVPFTAADKVYLYWADADVLAVSPILVNGYDVTTPLEIEAPGS